jgi:hypothetical protein
MGRKSHNKTYEQILNEKRIRAIEYYRLNSNIIKKKARDRYNRIKLSAEGSP